jgi:HD-like signal output (HDOD) protein
MALAPRLSDMCELADPISGGVAVKRRVLFVDDEPNILEGLRLRLHGQRHQWEMSFVESGEAALELLSRTPIDVIVTDLRMPRMDGATLLQHVHQRYPHIVRIVLSGHAELQTSLRAVNVAHQFLTKPSEPGVIENSVERACSLQLLINDDKIREAVGRVDHLPSLPRVYSQLKVMLLNENASAGQVADIMKKDMAICAKTLQLVNSAFFRLSRSIVEIEEAVMYLGFSTILQITLAVEVFQQGRVATGPVGVSLHHLQGHAVLVAQVASGLFTDKKQQEDAFVTGLLHDIGKLILAVELPSYLDALTTEMHRSGCSSHEAEITTLGVTHAEVGGYLLGLWGLPYSVIEAVANHHAPWHVDTREMGMLAATYIANGLVHDLCAQGVSDDQASSLNPTYIESLGVTGQIAEWREKASREVAKRTTDTR